LRQAAALLLPISLVLISDFYWCNILPGK
jgi:hypothetical protein